MPKRLYPKLLLIMRLTTVIIIASLMQVTAATFGQRITLNQRNATLSSVLMEIRKQSGFDIVYDGRLIPPTQKISITLDNAPLEIALKSAFKGLDLNYNIEGKIVTVSKRTPSFLDKVVSTFAAIDIRGIVLDEKGQPLLGATVRVKNTSKVVSTDANGEFRLNDISENAVLQISFLGFKTQEISVGQSRNITVKMEVGTSDLQEIAVVSTGYQILPKERATGAFNTISKEQLDKPSTNIAQRLIGTTAGMQAVLDADGNPRFEIRGQTSLNIRDANGALTSNAVPLVVVDGFPIQGDFNTINPNDVESVTILKDAAAASIWGAKSANGVIVIVTKKANRSTPLKVNFSAFTRLSGKLDLDYANPMATSAESVDFAVKAFGNWGSTPVDATIASPFGSTVANTVLNEFYFNRITLAEKDAQLEKLRNQNNKQQIKDELLASPSLQQYNLSLYGGSEKMSNMVSMLYEDNQAYFRGTNAKKYIVNYRTDADLFKWLQFSFGGQVNYNKGNNNGVTLGDIQLIAPYQMLRNENGGFEDLSTYYKPAIDRLVPKSLFPYANWAYNPIQEVDNRKKTIEELNTRLQAGLKFKLIKGLTFDTKIQYELFNTTLKDIYNENTFLVRNTVNTASTWNQTTNVVTPNLPKGGFLDQTRFKTQNYNFRNQLNFDRQFGNKHELNFVAGSEISSSVNEKFGNPRTYGFNEETLSVGTFPNGPGGSFRTLPDWRGTNQVYGYTNTYSYFTDRYFSLFGNLAYTYNGKYTVSGSVRTDASNLITDDPSYRYAPFWSVGLGWQLSKEEFMKDVTWVDRVSLRATYGYNGNVDRSTSFRPLIAMAAIPNTFTSAVTATISSFGNPTLRWEKTGTWNVGVDYSLFKGVLYGKLDVYNKSGKDLIATLSIPAANGTTTQKLNNAEMSNKGFELELGTQQKIWGNNITWRGNLNFSYNKNKITKLFVATYDAFTLSQGGSGAYVEGADANSLWRYQYAGIVNNQPTIQGPNGTTYDFSTFAAGDGRSFMQNTGTAVAPYTVGFINSFKVYDFDLSFIVTGKFGHVFQRQGFNYPGAGGIPNNKLSEVLNSDPMKLVPLPLNQLEPRYFSGAVFILT